MFQFIRNSLVVFLAASSILFACDDLFAYYQSGAYHEALEQALEQAKCLVQKNFATTVSPAIVLDIDETSLSNLPAMQDKNFLLSEDERHALARGGQLPAIQGTLELVKFAKENNIAVYFVTGRDESLRDATVANLQHSGFNDFDGLYMREPNQTCETAQFKAHARQAIESLGHHIILNVGDQTSDLLGGHADHHLKLPNPFYHIP